MIVASAATPANAHLRQPTVSKKPTSATQRVEAAMTAHALGLFEATINSPSGTQVAIHPTTMAVRQARGTNTQTAAIIPIMRTTFITRMIRAETTTLGDANKLVTA
jgi:hypothetical protein